MKSSPLAVALVLAAALIIVEGCAEPDPAAKNTAKNTAETENANEPLAKASVTPRKSDLAKADAAGTRNRSGDASSESNQPRTGNSGSGQPAQPPSAEAQPNRDAATKGSLDGRGSKNDVASKRSSGDSKRSNPKKEFKLEFVSANGKEGLSPGNTVPNIKGEDIDGIKFQLSDYKGKVIMIDFWGDW